MWTYFKLSGQEYRVRRNRMGRLELFQKKSRKSEISGLVFDFWDHVFDGRQENRVYERFVAESLGLTSHKTLEV